MNSDMLSCEHFRYSSYFAGPGLKKHMRGGANKERTKRLEKEKKKAAMTEDGKGQMVERDKDGLISFTRSFLSVH